MPAVRITATQPTRSLVVVKLVDKDGQVQMTAKLQPGESIELPFYKSEFDGELNERIIITEEHRVFLAC